MKPQSRLLSLLADTVRAHTMNFETPPAPRYGDVVGTRILAAFVAVGIGVFFALRLGFNAAGVRELPVAKLAFVLALLLAFIAVQRWFMRAPFASIGLRGFAHWTRLERLYFIQMVPLATVMFSIVFRHRLLALVEVHGPAGFVLFSIFTGILWGMVQEFLYRGWLQTELSRRFGWIAGLLIANAAFTFGPLHFDYLVGTGGLRWGGLASVFAIGLIFGFLYRRSGNLWIPATLHGLWPLNMA